MDIEKFRQRAESQFASRAMKSVFIPPWNETIYYKSPNLETIKAASINSKGEPLEMGARIVVACATDENGTRIWPNSAQYKDLMTKYEPDGVSALIKAIMEGVSGMSDPQQQAEDEKN